jgi:hypothetical protein
MTQSRTPTLSRPHVAHPRRRVLLELELTDGRCTSVELKLTGRRAHIDLELALADRRIAVRFDLADHRKSPRQRPPAQRGAACGPYDPRADKRVTPPQRAPTPSSAGVAACPRPVAGAVSLHMGSTCAPRSMHLTPRSQPRGSYDPPRTPSARHHWRVTATVAEPCGLLRNRNASPYVASVSAFSCRAAAGMLGAHRVGQSTLSSITVCAKGQSS